MKPEIQEALAVIERVCASVQANLADHQVMQHALTLIRNELTPVAPEPAEEVS